MERFVDPVYARSCEQTRIDFSAHPDAATLQEWRSKMLRLIKEWEASCTPGAEMPPKPRELLELQLLQYKALAAVMDARRAHYQAVFLMLSLRGPVTMVDVDEARSDASLKSIERKLQLLHVPVDYWRCL